MPTPQELMWRDRYQQLSDPERLTASGIELLRRAEDVAKERHRDVVGTDELLVAVIEHGTRGVASQVRRRLGESAQGVAEAVLQEKDPAPDFPPDIPLGVSNLAAEVLDKVWHNAGGRRITAPMIAKSILDLEIGFAAVAMQRSQEKKII